MRLIQLRQTEGRNLTVHEGRYAPPPLKRCPNECFLKISEALHKLSFTGLPASQEAPKNKRTSSGIELFCAGIPPAQKPQSFAPSLQCLATSLLNSIGGLGTARRFASLAVSVSASACRCCLLTIEEIADSRNVRTPSRPPYCKLVARGERGRDLTET